MNSNRIQLDSQSDRRIGIRQRTERMAILLALASLLLFIITSCTSTAQRQQEQQSTVLQQSLVLRIIELLEADKL